MFLYNKLMLALLSILKYNACSSFNFNSSL
jgi:hypothetical protein